MRRSGRLRDDDGQWPLEATLAANDAEPDDGFGLAVDLVGLTAIVGAPREDEKGPEAGADILTVLSRWGDCPDMPDLCPGDLDGNRTVDTNDMLLMITYWD